MNSPVCLFPLPDNGANDNTHLMHLKKLRYTSCKAPNIETGYSNSGKFMIILTKV